MNQPNDTSFDLASLLLDPAHRDLEPRQGQIGHTSMTVKSVDEKSRQVHFLCSTGQVDRYGESVDPAALKAAIPAFMMNPVFPAGHVYIGGNGEPTVIGHWLKLWVSDAGLEGIAQFDDEDPLAIRYWRHYAKGNLRAVSIGFITRGWEMRETKTADGQTRRVRVFTEVDLIEISAVTIPANPAALVRAAAAPQTASGAQGDVGDGYTPEDLQTVVKQALIELFTAGTEVSFARTLALEIVEVMRSCQDHGGNDYFDDFQEDDEQPDPSSLSKGQPTIKEILREIMPA